MNEVFNRLVFLKLSLTMFWSQIITNDKKHFFFLMFFSKMPAGPWETWGHWWGGICFCAIYESDRWKAELEHENDEDDISSECDNSQDTVQAAVPGGVTTDEGSSYSFLNYLNVTAINIQICFLAKFPTWKFEKISQASHFPGKTRPSAVVAEAGEKARGAMSWWMLEKSSVFPEIVPQKCWRCRIRPKQSKTMERCVQDTQSCCSDHK